MSNFACEDTQQQGLDDELWGLGIVLNNTRGYWKVKFPSPPPYMLPLNMSHCSKSCQHILMPEQLFSVVNTGLMRNFTGTGLCSGGNSVTIFNRAALV